MVIVNKPADFLTIPDRQRKDVSSLVQWLREKYGEIFIVHRLDRETSGIICFARNAEAHRNLSIQFEKRKTTKHYYAIVEGRPEPTGRIEIGLEPHPAFPGKMKPTRQGKQSLTEYTVLEQFRDHALVRCDIYTGRMHQIRVHMAYVKHPLSVDYLYGNHDKFFLSSVKKAKGGYKLSKNEEEERPLMARTTLHAKSLTLAHPTTGETMTFECDPPKDFQAMLTQLGKWGK